MDKDLIKIIPVLKKVLPKLLDNPKIMAGRDISDEEIEEILYSRKLSINVLQNVAGDAFFEAHHKILNLNPKEAKEVAEFLCNSAENCINELKESFYYIKE